MYFNPFEPLDYEKIILERQITNQDSVISEFSTKGMKEKIENYAKSSGLNKRFVRMKALSDAAYCYRFAKPSNKQNIYETLAINYIKRFPIIKKAHKLSPSGSNSKFIYNGKITKYSELPNKEGEKEEKDKPHKSIDFYWQYTFLGRTVEFYATHKYTKEAGGSQDHQKDEAEKFLKNAKMSRDPDLFFFAILDGPYYENKSFSEFKNYDHISICTINELFPIILSKIENWLKTNFKETEIKSELAKLKAYEIKAA